jgi:hypothetical protein
MVMFDWKIIAAVFIALLVVSYIVIGVPGISEFFGNIASGAGNLLEGSPFGGIFSSGAAGGRLVEVTLYPDGFTLEPELPVNVSFGDGTLIEGFKGGIMVDLNNGTISMSQEGSSLVISPKLNMVWIYGLKISRIGLDNITASVKSGDAETSIEDGALEITGFLGEARITRNDIKLIGNVTLVKGDGWEIS